MANELNKALWITVGGLLGTALTCYLVNRVQNERTLDREYNDMLNRVNARTANLREAVTRAVKAQVRVTVTHGFGGADEIIALTPAELDKLQSIMPHLESAPLPERAVWKRRRQGLSNHVKSPAFYRHLVSLEFLDAEGNPLPINLGAVWTAPATEEDRTNLAGLNGAIEFPGFASTWFS